MTAARPGPAGGPAEIVPVPAERRHTLTFLSWSRGAAPVFLDTEVDMSAVVAHRRAAEQAGRRYSMVAYVLHAAGRVLARHPDANAALRGRSRPRIARYGTVNAKVALDKRLNGQRVVLAALLTGVHRSSLEQIQGELEYWRRGDPDHMQEFAGLRKMQRMPWPLRSWANSSAVSSLRRRPHTMGTFAVSSLGHRPVNGFHSFGGTTITLGVGQTTERAVIRDGTLASAPVMQLNLAFDHRVIDGAHAADVLTEIKDALEGFVLPADGGDAAQERSLPGKGA
ncbi:2-oxo acid dehydrogenase subunit E2 [Actinomadura verrucosospora]|uniref:Acyltransferase n=1 Tax=Actinomadura verrucosospora TaxID=46165 RepID=A0A7D3VVQ3_ACTVE|nr:2-oxo acid dehydrogenase subunit E2 [Actinomadura verrucosospora]QKG20151.1 Acyltransferase [Actinomadura verrucosospora]